MCSGSALRPWLLACLVQPWVPLPVAARALVPSLPSVVARVKCVLRPV